MGFEKSELNWWGKRRILREYDEEGVGEEGGEGEEGWGEKGGSGEERGGEEEGGGEKVRRRWRGRRWWGLRMVRGNIWFIAACCPFHTFLEDVSCTQPKAKYIHIPKILMSKKSSDKM